MSDIMDLKNDQTLMAMSTGDMSWNKTGSWRYMRPLYENKIPPCTVGCPAHEKIPQYFALVKEKKYKEAWEVILPDNPMPGVTGRVCYHPCESVCNRGEYDETIAIHNMERFVADQNLENHIPDYLISKEKRPEKVAIVGSGPAGLSAAYQLVRQGFSVTVFESANEAGGMLRIGIPSYRLPREILDKEIDDIKRLGVEIRAGVTIGKDLPMSNLQKNYDAVLIAVGAYKSWGMQIPGENLKGIRSGLDYLKQYNLQEQAATGQNVVVVGGGNTAIDTARSALRMGAEKVTIVYRRSRAEMPAVPEEIEDAAKEGVQFIFLSNPIAFHGNDKVQEVELIKMELGEPDQSGRRRPNPVKGSEYRIKADQVLLAIGEVPDLDFTEGKFKLLHDRLNLDAGQMTSQKGIFACGDAANGPIGTVVDAIATGHRAATAIGQYLRDGKVSLNGKMESGVSFDTINLDYFTNEPRPKEQQQHPTELKENFAEVNLGITIEDALYEANRCFSCGTCTYCDNCLIFCPDVAIHLDPVKHEYIIDYDYCKGCGVCVHECPRNAMAFEEELKWNK